MASQLNQRSNNIIRVALIGVNLMMLLFITVVIRAGTDRIVRQYRARVFLESLSDLPLPVEHVQGVVLACYATLVVLLLLQLGRFRENRLAAALLFVAEMLFCLIIIRYLGFNYKGVLFLPIVGIITSTRSNRERSVFIGIVVVLYILMDFDIISARYSVNTLSDYINLFNAQTRFFLYGLRSLLAGLNDMLFVLFMVMTIYQETRQAHRFKDLYAQISQYAEELKIINLQLEEYSRQSEQNAMTRERNRMAREIHDVLGHTLTSISAAVDACLALIDRDPARTKEQLVRVGEVARNSLDEVRRSVHALKPDVLERFSLGTALRKMTDDINKITNTRIELDYPEEGICFTDEGKAHVYRIVQESITNSVRHGRASKNAIRARVRDGEASIIIQDNGSGCMVIKEGFGLAHIREGVEAMGGTVRYRGMNGFETTVTLPIQQEEETE